MTLVDEARLPVTLPPQTPVEFPGATQFDLASKIAGRTYRIFVLAPMLPPPPEGYPVITVTDGNMNFPLAGVMARMFQGTRAALVVGVGYPTDAPFDLTTLRLRDLTPVTPMENIRVNPGMAPAEPQNYGGAELFRRFLIEELRPAIAAGWSVNPAEQTLYGYSLGGLFALDCLFADPASFKTYVAGSPSIWWNNRALLEREAAFSARVETGEVAPRILITIGEREQDPPAEAPPGMSPEEMRELIAEARMVENALELGSRLARLKGAKGYDARFHCFEGEDHLSCMAAAAGRAVDFALRP